MPAYEIRYFNGKGRTTHGFRADCDCDTKARVAAHAMKTPSDSGLEVWRGDILIYQRPAQAADFKTACFGSASAGTPTIFSSAVAAVCMRSLRA